MKIKISPAQRVFDIFNTLLMLLLSVVMIYPMWYVLMASLSDNNLIIGHMGVLLKPLDFTTVAYELMIKNEMIPNGYINTIKILIGGLSANMFLTLLGAYALSRRGLMWQKPIMVFIIFTMFFSGGLIPSYLLVTQTLHLNNSLWALILPGAMNTYNFIIMRSAFATMPESLIESAALDGAGPWKTLFKIAIPLSMPTIAVIILYYAVTHWNSWFAASIYIKDRAKYPLQLVLREILISNDTNSMMENVASDQEAAVSETVKYAIIVAATLPILCVYPFLQKYFVKGVMVGAVKG